MQSAAALEEFVIIALPYPGLFDDWTKEIPDLEAAQGGEIEKFCDLTANKYKVVDLLRQQVGAQSVVRPPSDTYALGAGLSFSWNSEAKAYALGENPNAEGPISPAILKHNADNSSIWVADLNESYQLDFVSGIRLDFEDGPTSLVRVMPDTSRAGSADAQEAQKIRKAMFGDAIPSILWDDASPLGLAIWKTSASGTGTRFSRRSESEKHLLCQTVNGWFRPFVIRMSISDSNIPDGFECGVTNPANALRKLLSPGCLKVLQPVFPRDADSRYRFFKRWWQLILERLGDAEPCASNLTPLERLVFHPGAKPPDPPPGFADAPWYPFFTLDLLGGEWVIEEHGTGAPQFRWCMPHKPSLNLRWFGEHWVKRWGGLSGVFGERPARVVPSPGSIQPSRILGGDRGLQRPASAGCSSASAPGACGIDILPTDFELTELLPRSPIIASFPTISADTMPPEIRVSIDAANGILKKSCVDLIKSRYEQMVGFMTRLTRAADTIQTGKTMILPFDRDYPWWCEWIEALFDARSDLVIKFEESRYGMILGQLHAHLGDWRLGKEQLSSGPDHRQIVFFE